MSKPESADGVAGLRYRRIDSADSFFKDDGSKLFEFWLGHSCALVAIGEAPWRWATVYEISTEPKHRGKGECQKLLKALKALFEALGARFALWCPMNDTIEHICEKLGVMTV